jgi:hypothetical protein
MTSKDAKSMGFKALEALGVTIGQRIVTGLTLALLAFMVTTGKGMVRSVYAQETRKVMAPAVDSMALRDSLTNSRIDSLQGDLTQLKAAQAQATRMQVEFYGAQLDRDTVLRRYVRERGENSRKIAEKKAETEKLIFNLTGGTP